MHLQMSSRRTSVVLAPGVSLFAGAAGAQTTTNIQPIRDASGNMLGKLPGGPTGTCAVLGPRSAGAGSVTEVKWTGPNNPGDYVTIVAKGAPISEYKDCFYTRNGNPGALR